MRLAKSGRAGAVLFVVGVVVAASATGGALAADRATATEKTDGLHAVGTQTDEAVGPQTEETDESNRGAGASVGQAENNETGNGSLASLGVPSLSVTIDGTTVSAETILFTVRQGTGSLYVKTLTTQNPDEDASITNARVAVGDRFWQQLETGEFDGSQYTVSFGQFAVGDVEFRLGTRVVRGVIGGAPPGQIDAEETDQQGIDRSSFTVTNFSAPENVTVGESFTVSATVRNPGSGNGTEIVRYQFGDVMFGKKVVQLGPNESTNVTYQVSGAALPDSPGTFTHRIEAFDSNVTAQIRLVAPNATSENGSAANATRPPVLG